MKVIRGVAFCSRRDTRFFFYIPCRKPLKHMQGGGGGGGIWGEENQEKRKEASTTNKVELENSLVVSN